MIVFISYEDIGALGFHGSGSFFFDFQFRVPFHVLLDV